MFACMSQLHDEVMSQLVKHLLFIIPDPDEVMPQLDDEDIFACIYNESNSLNETVNVDDIPEIDDDEEINITCQIQATLASTEEFKEYVLETDNIDRDHKLSEDQKVMEELFLLYFLSVSKLVLLLSVTNLNLEIMSEWSSGYDV